MQTSPRKFTDPSYLESDLEASGYKYLPGIVEAWSTALRTHGNIQPKAAMNQPSQGERC